MQKKVFICLLFSITTTILFSQNMPLLVRQPYLQMGNQNAITIRWRTDIACDSKVSVGLVWGEYSMVVSNDSITTEHAIRIGNLSADTKYYYTVGTSSVILQGAKDNFFTTVPPSDTKRKIRVVAFGDCGRSNSTYQDENLANYRSFLYKNGIDAPDALLLLGDNAYNEGTDAQYTAKFFGIYGNTLLKNHKLYPAPGNHDYGDSEKLKPRRDLPYYKNFSVPENGECGGLPSGKPNFYSFDIGNIHFLSLDSWGLESDSTDMGSSGNSMIKSWVNKDLDANKSKWTIAYWHHPPYTKGSHNSDNEQELVDIRTNFIDELEKHGVDIIICGHSHNYERGYLLRGFRGYWNTFDPQVDAVSTSKASYTSSGTCPYVYNSSPSNHGTVYVVSGSSGASGTVKTGFGSYAMPFAVNDGGVFYFEVVDNRLDAKMLRRDGTVFDQFTIIKDANINIKVSINEGDSAVLTASWPGSKYLWNNSDTSRSILVRPPMGTYTYTVADNYSCLVDTFTLNVSKVLPVRLVRFNVYIKDNRVYINWTTAAEKDSKYFDVERSADGLNFMPIAKVNATGNIAGSDYSVTDEHPLYGIGYYRLKMIDADSSVRLSDVRKIYNGKAGKFEVNFIPAVNDIKLFIQSAIADKVDLEIYEQQGRLIENIHFAINSGTTIYDVPISKGLYILKMVRSDREKIIKKVLVP